MSKVASEMATRCELALMGKVVEVRDNSEVVPMLEYCMSAMGVESLPEDLMDRIEKHHNVVKYLVCNTLYGEFKVATLLLESKSKCEEDKYPAPFKEDHGTGYPCAFCYVLNLTDDMCSEFGDCFFQKKRDGFYHRVS